MRAPGALDGVTVDTAVSDSTQSIVPSTKGVATYRPKDAKNICLPGGRMRDELKG